MRKILLILITFFIQLKLSAQEWETVAFMPMNFEVTQIHVADEQNIVVASEFYKLLQWKGEEWNTIGDFENGFAIPHFFYLDDDNIYATKNDYLNGNDENYNYIAHWNGSEWSNAHDLNVSKPINKIHVINHNEIYAVGEFTLPGYNWKPVAKYSEGNWSVVGIGDSQAGSYSTYSSLWVNNENDIYTTSGYSDAGVIRIKHWNGENWHVFYHYQLDQAERLSQPVPGENGSVYAFGYKVSTGESCITRWNGEFWEILGNIEEDLNTHNSAFNSRIIFKYVNENEIYAVGGKLRDATTNKFKVAKWDGESWSELGNIDANSTISSLEIYNGYLYVSGSFTEAFDGMNRTLIKRYKIGETLEQFEVQATVNPEEAGSIVGNGTYLQGEIVSLEAIANPNYIFENWTENNEIVSENEVYEFEINSNRNLVANFTYDLSVNDFDISNINFYPNPTKDILYFDNPNSIEFDVVIYDLNGKLILQKEMNSSKVSKLNISHLNKGNYLLNIISNGKIISSKKWIKN